MSLSKPTKQEKLERAEAADELRKILQPGTRVYCILRHCSKSGMQRVIDLALVDEDKSMRRIGYLAARAMGDRFDGDRGGVVIGGCGMDMGFALVYNLSRTLFVGGFGCIGRSEANGRSVWCPSSDHGNGDRDYTRHCACEPCDAPNCAKDGIFKCGPCGRCAWHEGHAPGCGGCPGEPGRRHWHTDGGYALKSEWL